MYTSRCPANGKRKVLHLHYCFCHLSLYVVIRYLFWLLIRFIITYQGGPATWDRLAIWPTQNFGWLGHNAFLPINNYCSLILGKISKLDWCHRMSDFKAKMHQIRIPLPKTKTPLGELITLLITLPKTP